MVDGSLFAGKHSVKLKAPPRLNRFRAFVRLAEFFLGLARRWLVLAWLSSVCAGLSRLSRRPEALVSVSCPNEECSRHAEQCQTSDDSDVLTGCRFCLFTKRVSARAFVLQLTTPHRKSLQCLRPG